MRPARPMGPASLLGPVNARQSFRRLLTVASFTGLMLSLAVASPVLVGWLLEHDQESLSRQSSLLACLFLPTVHPHYAGPELRRIAIAA